VPDDFRILLALVLVFVPLSLLSIGGGASLLADMEHQSVTVRGWTSPREFADLFAISRAAPGPGTMLAVLRISPGGPAVWAAAVVATVLLLLWPRLHPLALFATSGALFGLAALW